MSVRLIGTVLGAVAIGTLVVACGTNEPTTPRSLRLNTPAFATASTCSSPDVTPPTINALSASPNVLWPPNHKFVPVSVSVSATDNCGGTPVCSISSVSSNEPVNGLGDGDTAPDWIITSGSTVLLRAERSGLGNGRVYTITVSCRDASGNTSSATTTVLVPHDQGNSVNNKCTKDDHGQGDDKNGGDRDLENKCKHAEGNDTCDKCTKDDLGQGDDKNGGDRDLDNKCKNQNGSESSHGHEQG